MRTRKEILEDERMIINLGNKETLPIHTEILLDIRDLLLKSQPLKCGLGGGS